MFGLYRDPFLDTNGSEVEEPTMASTYKGILRDHSIGRINRIIENCTFEDSSSVYERFFLDCHSEIQIVARGIKSQILDREGVLKAVNHFFARAHVFCGIHIPIKTKEDLKELESSEFFRVVTDAASGSDKLRFNLYDIAVDDFIPDLPSVTFGDNRMYRKRTFSEVGDYSTTANASVNFNDTDMVVALREQTMQRLVEISKLES